MASILPSSPHSAWSHPYHFTTVTAPRHDRIASQMPYVKVNVDYILNIALPGFPPPQDSFAQRLFAYAHMEAPWWYFRTKVAGTDGPYRWSGIWLFGSIVRDSLRMPDASMDTETLRRFMNCVTGNLCHYWMYYGKNNTRVVTDDQFERFNLNADGNPIGLEAPADSQGVRALAGDRVALLSRMESATR